MIRDQRTRPLDPVGGNSGLSSARIAAVRSELANAQKASGGACAKLLATSAAIIAADVNGAADKGRVALLQNAVMELSKKK